MADQDIELLETLKDMYKNETDPDLRRQCLGDIAALKKKIAAAGDSKLPPVGSGTQSVKTHTSDDAKSQTPRSLSGGKNLGGISSENQSRHSGLSSSISLDSPFDDFISFLAQDTLAGPENRDQYARARAISAATEDGSLKPRRSKSSRDSDKSAKKAEAKAAKKAAENARQLAEAEEIARKIAEDEARKVAEEETARLLAEENARKVAEEEAARHLAEEEARRVAEEETARKLAEEEARKLAEDAAEQAELIRLENEKVEKAAELLRQQEASRMAEESAKRAAAEEADTLATLALITTSPSDSPDESHGMSAASAHHADFYYAEAKDRYELFAMCKAVPEKVYDKDVLKGTNMIQFLRDSSLLRTVHFPDEYFPYLHHVFYANVTQEFADPESPRYGRIFLRGKAYDFRPEAINDFFGRRSLVSDNWSFPSPSDPAKINIAKVLTGGTRLTESPKPSELTQFFSLLHRINSSNWVANNGSTITEASMYLLYRLARGIPINLGQLIFQNLCMIGMHSSLKIAKTNLPHPFLITGMLDKQGFPFSEDDGEILKASKAIVYKMGSSKFKDLPYKGFLKAEDIPEVSEIKPAVISSGHLPTHVPADFTDLTNCPEDPMALDTYLSSPQQLAKDLAVAHRMISLGNDMIANIHNRAVHCFEQQLRGGGRLGQLSKLAGEDLMRFDVTKALAGLKASEEAILNIGKAQRGLKRAEKEKEFVDLTRQKMSANKGAKSAAVGQRSLEVTDKKLRLSKDPIIPKKVGQSSGGSQPLKRKTPSDPINVDSPERPAKKKQTILTPAKSGLRDEPTESDSSSSDSSANDEDEAPQKTGCESDATIEE